MKSEDMLVEEERQSSVPRNRIAHKNMLEYVLFDEINIENRLFVSWEMFEKAMTAFKRKVRELEQDGRKFDGIYALPRGGLCLGVKLSYMTGIPMVLEKKDMTKDTLVVDDCTDTGKTLSTFRDYTTFVMFHKPTSCFTPTFFYEETDKQINFCWESIEERN